MTTVYLTGARGYIMLQTELRIMGGGFLQLRHEDEEHKERQFFFFIIKLRITCIFHVL